MSACNSSLCVVMTCQADQRLAGFHLKVPSIVFRSKGLRGLLLSIQFDIDGNYTCKKNSLTWCIIKILMITKTIQLDCLRC